MKSTLRKYAVPVAILCLMGVVLNSAVANAQEPPGKAQSKVCAACHGAEGVSNNTLWPNIAGQKKDYLLKQMRDFQSGERKNPLMTSLIQTLSESDLENLSVYYSQLKAD